VNISGSIFINKIHLFDGNKQSIISKASDDAGHLQQSMSLWRSDSVGNTAQKAASSIGNLSIQKQIMQAAIMT